MSYWSQIVRKPLRTAKEPTLDLFYFKPGTFFHIAISMYLSPEFLFSVYLPYINSTPSCTALVLLYLSHVPTFRWLWLKKISDFCHQWSNVTPLWVFTTMRRSEYHNISTSPSYARNYSKLNETISFYHSDRSLFGKVGVWSLCTRHLQ